MTHHLRGTSVAFAEKVFMSEKRARKLRVQQPHVNLLRSWMPDKKHRLATDTAALQLYFV